MQNGTEVGGTGGLGRVVLTYTDPPVSVKADNTNDLNLTSSWTAHVPHSLIAEWTSTVLAANTTLLGANLTFDGVKISSPGGPVTINPGIPASNTLTLGDAAIDLDLSAATQDLTVNSNLALGAANVWDVAATRALTLGGAITGAQSVTKQGLGTATLSGLSATPASNYSGTTTIANGTLALTTTSPSLTGGLTFGTTPGTLNLSAVASSATFAGALTAQTNSLTPNTITLGTAKTLTFNGGLTMSNNTDAAVTSLTMTGGGALVVNGVSVTVGNNTAGANVSSEAHLNVAALDSFTSTLSGNLTIQASGDNSSADPASLTLSDVANSITAAAVRVGNSATGSTNRLWLGSGTNVIKTDLINLGAGARDTGVIDFAGSGGSVSLRNVAGTGRIAAVNLGPQTAQATATGTNSLIDVTGNTADIAIGTFATSLGAKAANNNNNLRFDAGTLDILSLNMAFAKGTGVSTNRITIGGGTVRLGGSAAFSDAGTGTLTLATAGTGDLLINGGTVTTTADLLKGTGGTGTASVTLNGGTLNVTGQNIGSATDTVVLAAQAGTLQNLAELNGGGALTKTTAGTLVLDGTSGYTGPTLVSGGSLQLDGSAGTSPTTSDITVNNLGSTLGFSNGLASTLNLTGKPLTLGGGTLAFDIGAPGTNDLITVTDFTLTADSSIAIKPVGLFSTSSSYTVLTSANPINTGGFSLSAQPIGKLTLTPTVNANSVVITPSLDESAWNFNGSENWDTGVNWTGYKPTAAGDAALFGSVITSPATVAVNAPQTIGYLRFNNANSYTIGSNVSGNLTLDNTSSPALVSVTAGSHTIAENVTLASDVIVAPASSSALALSGILSGAKSFTHAGAGTTTLSGANSYSGATAINNGTVILSGSGTLGATGLPLTMGGGALNLGTTSQTVGAVSITAPAASGDTLSNGSLTGTSYAASNTSGNAVISTNLLGSGAFTKSGAGITTLGGTNSFTGATTVTGGVLASTGTFNNGTSTTILGGAASTQGMLYVPSGSYSSSTLIAGNNATGIGSIVVAGGNVTGTTGTISVPNVGIYLGANNSYGGLFLSSGSVTTPRVEFGGVNNSTGTGVLRVTGGTLTSTEYIIPRTAKFEFTVTGGSVIHNAASQNIALGYDSGGRGTMTVAGGTVNNTGRNITIRQNGGTPNVSINLNGGNTITNSIVKNNAAGTGVLNFNGGTLTAATPGGNLVNGANGLTAYVNGAFGAFSGGAVIDTAGQAANTITASLLAPTGNGVSGLSVGSPGSGYIGAPVVEIDGDGTGATAYAVVDLNPGSGTFGQVTSVVLTNPGIGYTAPPTVSLSGGGGSGAAITVSGITANTSGGLTKTGLGTLTLTGASTYTGSTVISGGTLQLNGAAATTPTTSGVVVNTVGSALGFTSGSASNLDLTGKTLSLGGGTLAFDIGSTAVNDTITVNAFSLTANSSVAINPIGAFTNGGSYTVLTSATPISTGAFSLSGTPVGRLSVIPSVSSNTVTITPTLDEGIWNKALGGGDWSLGDPGMTSGNWNNYRPTVAGDAALFGSAITAPATINVDAPFALGYMRFNNANAYTIGNNGSGNLTLDNAAAPALVAVTSGSHTIAEDVTLNSNLLVAPLTGTTLTVSGILSGTGKTLQKVDGGTLVLSGTGSYTGTTTVSAGTLSLTGSLTGGAAIAVTDTGVLNQSSTGVISGASSITHSSSGTSTLAGVNTYTGSTTISSGQLTIDDGSISTSSSTINNAALEYKLNTNARSYANAISGSGSLTKSGTNTLTLSSASTNYSGATLVSAGTLSLNNTTAFASPTTVSASGTLQYSPTATNQQIGVGAISLLGTMTYAPATNSFQVLGTFAGNKIVTVSGGSSVINISPGGTFAASTGGLYLDGGLQGSTALTVNATANGFGLVLRTGTSNYSGTMIVNGTASTTPGTGSGLSIGFLNATANATLPNANLTINGTLELGNSTSGMGWAAGTTVNLSGKTFGMNALNGTGVIVANMQTAASTRTVSVGNNGGTGDFSGVIANGSNNTLSFTKAGSGTQTLSGLNTFSGNVLISDGTVIANATETASAAPLGAANNTRTITVDTGATLQLAQGKALKALFSSSNVPSLVINGTVNDTNLSNPGNNPLGNVTLNSGTLTASVGNANGYGAYNLNGTVTSTGSSLISSTAVVPITLSAAGGSNTTFDVQSGTLNVTAGLGQVTAVGDEKISSLTKSGVGTLNLSGANTYTGNTIVNAGTLQLADNAQLKFVTGAVSESKNGITGTGTVTLDGDFVIDTAATDATALTTGTWTLVDKSTLAATFNPSFTILGAEWSVTGDTWTKTVGSKKYTFTEADGKLTLSPSASYASWIDGFGLVGLNALETADPDFDGIANAVEMVIGGNPATGMDTALLPTLELVTNPVGVPNTIPAGDYLLFTYRRTDLSDTAGVLADCETSTDLVTTWTAATGAFGVVIQEDDNYGLLFTPPAPANTDRVRVYVPRGVNTTLFGRLRVDVPVP